MHRPLPSNPPPRPLLPDLRWGLGWGLAMATVYSAWALVVVGMRGGAPAAKPGISVGQVVGGYCAGAVLGGLLLGACRPLTRSREGAKVVGALVGAATYCALAVGLYGWSRATLALGACIGAPFGFIAGLHFYEKAEGGADVRPG